MNPQGNKTVFLLGSLGLGAGLMYLLDPERGQQRRRRGLENAAYYRDHADEALGYVTRGLGQSTASLSQQARSFINKAQRQWPRVSWSPTSLRSQARQTTLWPTLSWLGGVAVGAGLMYLFDPRDGRQRRQAGLTRARSYWKKTHATLDKTTRELWGQPRERLSEGQKRNHQEQTEAPKV